MAEEKSLRCSVCGYPNPPGSSVCQECGNRLGPMPEAGVEDEIERLLEDLGEIEAPVDVSPKEKGRLDIEKEIVDELLDSLLVEEEKEMKEEMFECPICGTTLSADAVVCTGCGVEFEAPAPPVERVAPVPVEKRVEEEIEALPKVEVSEADLSKIRGLSGRLIDLTVIGTIILLVIVFLAFGMYSATAINALSLSIFGGVAIGGMIVGLTLFRISTSAMAQGDRLVKEGRYSEAIEYYNRAIRMGSKVSAAWSSKGVAFKRMKEYDEALRCEEIAIQLSPNNEFAWCNKGDVYFKLGEYEKAVSCYDKALEIRPRYAIAWNNKGAALARLGKFEEARRCHDRAIRLKPKYVAAWLNRGEVLVRLGRREEAEKALRRARSLGA